MKAVISNVKKTVSLVLAVMMVLTAIPQTSYAVYGADQSFSENETLNVDTETTVDETAATEETVEAPAEEAKPVSEEVAEEGPASDDEDGLEETQPEIIEEDILEDDSLEVEEESLLMEDTPAGKIKFDANGGKMTCDESHAIDSDMGEDGKCTWQTFNYFLRNDTQKYGVGVESFDLIKPVKEGCFFLGWFDGAGNRVNLYSDGFEDATDRTLHAEWLSESSDSKNIDMNIVKESIEYSVSEEGKVQLSFTLDKSNYENIQLPNSLALKLKFTYGAKDYPICYGSSKLDGYNTRWNGVTIDTTKDTEVTIDLFDTIPTKDVPTRLQLQYVTIEKDADNPNDYIIEAKESNNYKTNIIAVADPSSVLNDSYTSTRKMHFNVQPATEEFEAQSSGATFYQMESDGYYRELPDERDENYERKNEFTTGKAIAIKFWGFLESNSEDIYNSLKPTDVYARPNGSTEDSDFVLLEKKTIYAKSGNITAAIEDCYVIPAKLTGTDLEIKVETRLCYKVNKIQFNTEAAGYSVSYSSIPEDDNSWIEVENGILNSPMTNRSPSGDDENPYYEYDEYITENSIVNLKFTPNVAGKKIAKIAASDGRIYETAFDGIKCYALNLNDLESDHDTLTVNLEYLEANEGIGTVYYYEGDVAIEVLDAENNSVDVYHTEKLSGTYSRNLYKLTNGDKYTLTVKCNDGYYFNGYGVGFNGNHTNKNTTTPYIKTNFVAGNEIFTNTSECIHLIVNNANNTTYGGKGIKPTVKYYKPTDTAKTASTITESKKNSDGSFEYYLPVLDSDSGCYYQAYVNAKDANGSAVSATPKEGTPGGTHYGASRCVNLEVNSYTAGKYEWDVESVSSKYVPKIETTDKVSVQPTATNGNTFNVPWNKELKLTEKNIDGRVSKLQGVSAKCGNTTVSGITLKEDKSYISIPMLEDYAGKTITVTMYTDLCAVAGNTVTLKVVPAITSVTISGVKTVKSTDGDYSALTQEIGIVSGKDYAYTLLSAEKASLDELKAVVFADEEAANASGVNFNTQDSYNDNITVEIVAGNKINIATENAAPKDKAGYVVIYNKETNSKVAGFYVNTTAPAWAKTAPTVKATSTNDTEVNFVVTAPSIKTLSKDYYVKIKLISNSNYTQLPSYLKMNEEVIYVRANDDGTVPTKVVNPYIIKASEVVADELGEGCGAKFDAEVSVVLTKSGQSPAAEPDEVITETVAKKVTVTTVAARYADKISLKKSATNSIYAAAIKVAVATVDLGKNTDFKTTDFWKVKGIVDASGNDATSKFTTYGSDAVYNPGSPDKNDVNVYVTPKADTPAGKYKVIVQTVIGGTPQAVEAAGEFTVLPTIASLSMKLDGDGTYIYKKTGSALSKKVIISALDQDGKAIKSPKLTYEIGEANGDDIDPVEGLTVKNNAISMTKDFVPGSETTYKIAVKAADVTTGRTVATASIDDITISSDAQNVKTLELYVPNETDAGRKIQSSDMIPYRMVKTIVRAKVIAKDGTYLLGNASEPALIADNDKVYFDLSKIEYIKSAGSVPITVYGLDGTKASANVSITYDYSNDLDEFDDFDSLSVKDGASINDVLSDEGVLDVTGNPASQILTLSLSSADGEITTYDPAQKRYNYLIEGTMKTEGLKVLEKSSNSQYMKVQLTKPTATVKFTDKDKNVYIWTIKNDALSQVEAPKVATMVVNGANGTDKVYANYVYNSSTDDLILTLKNPIMNASKEVIPAEDITVEMIPSSHANFGTPQYRNVNIGTETKPKYITTIIVPIKGKLSGKTTLEFAYKDKTTGNYLTKTNTVATISPVAFKKSFAVNSAITMSLKDAYTVDIASKGTGVKSVTYENLLNFNKNGVYNEFADTFKINADKKTITVKDASKLIFKKNLPTALDGYVVAHVVYENGEEADVTSKVTVKWVDTTKKYTAVMPTITTDTLDGTAVIEIKAGGEACNVVEAALVNLLDKNFSEAGESGSGKVQVTLKQNAYSKPGTYSTNVLIVTDKTGYSDDLHDILSAKGMTDDEINLMFSIKVPVKVKVAKPQ